jgi:hypothetical protein
MAFIYEWQQLRKACRGSIQAIYIKRMEEKRYSDMFNLNYSHIELWGATINGEQLDASSKGLNSFCVFEEW